MTRAVSIIFWRAAALMAFVAASATSGEGGAPVKKEAQIDGLKFELVAPKKQYQLGEALELTLRISYTGTVKIGVYQEGERRDDGTPWTTFKVKNKKGGAAVREAYAPALAQRPSLRRAKPLASGGTHEQKIELNEWFCFDESGTYIFEGETKMAGQMNPGGRSLRERVTLTAAPLEIEIVAFDEKTRTAELAAAQTALKQADGEACNAALKQLWRMQDERAVPALVECLWGGIELAEKSRAAWALMRFKDMEPVKKALLKRIDDDPKVLIAAAERPFDTVLGEADARKEAGDKMPPTGNRAIAVSKWRSVLLRRSSDQLRKSDPPKAAAQLLNSCNWDAKAKLSPEEWRFIFQHTASLPKDANDSLVRALTNFELREFTPQLRRVAAETELSPMARSAAVVALQKMGDASLLEMVFLDLVSPKPMLTKAAHDTLGTQLEIERSAALIKLANGPEATVGLGERIRDFGGKATVDELLAAFAKLDNEETQEATGILTALAKVSPAATMPLLKKVLTDEEGHCSRVREESLKVLPTIDLPEARRLCAAYIMRMDEVSSILEGLQTAPAATKASLFPELLDWLIANPTNGDGDAVRQVLHAASELPKKEMGTMTPAEKENLISEWSKWWDEHKKDVDRKWMDAK